MNYRPAYKRRLARLARQARSTYGAEQPLAPLPHGPRPCSRRQEGDEYVCHCGARWDIHEERPPCQYNGSY